MREQLIEASNSEAWRKALEPFLHLDPTFLPEYHLAYSKRVASSRAYIWCFDNNIDYFCYPFLLTPVILSASNGSVHKTDFFDIQSIYGYTGPISTSYEPVFLKDVWQAFDLWSQNHKVIAEFVRFSPYSQNTKFSHPMTQISVNRKLAVSYLPRTEEELLYALGVKTRNMIKKANKCGLVSKELDNIQYINAFRKLYDNTMIRNKAAEFFLYDDEYYKNLMNLKEGEIRLFGVFLEGNLISASMAIIYGEAAMYHLGASLHEYSKLGAGNLSMYEMSKCLMRSDIKFVNITGGRSSALDDPLFRFKKSNATGLCDFYIGKRVVDNAGYNLVKCKWKEINKSDIESEKILFYAQK